MDLISNLKWRYATKEFDASKKVKPEDINFLKEAISLTATSYGLELYKVLIIENPEIKKQLMAASWKQRQVVDASHVFVFCNYTQISQKDIDAFISKKSDAHNIPLEQLNGYADFMKNSILKLPKDEINTWTAKQTYIALGTVLAACAELKIDSCPMEGFNKQDYNRILGLTDQGLNAVFAIPVGYRSENCPQQHLSKIRKPIDQLFTHL